MGGDVRVARWMLALVVGGCAGGTDESDGDADPVSVDCPVEGTEENPALGTVVCVPPGTFTMGCVADRDDVVDGCASHESPSRKVTLTRAFWTMEAEVTQDRYAAVVGSNPSSFPSCADCPVEEVSWDDAVAFADAVSVAQGLTPCGGDPDGCDGWRLPTEAEWEYAARGADDFAYAGSRRPDEVAWYAENAGNSYDSTSFPDGLECGGQTCTRPVCAKDRNGFGLCDMSGNVWEWTADVYGPYVGTAATNPGGPASGFERVIRGGGWNSSRQLLRVGTRSVDTPSFRGAVVGFRLVRSVP